MKQKKLIFSDLSKDELIDKLVDLDDRFEELLRQVLEKDKRIKELENQIGRNSQNSSKPPSMDGFKKQKTKSSRTKSEKTTGGQVGHKGTTLQQVDNPDVIKNHDVSECFSCKSDLTSVEIESIIRRQEVEIPQVKAVVTEHRISCKTCPKCKTQNIASAPKNITQPIQYGPNVNAIVSYLHYAQFIPFDRIQGMLGDVFNVAISEGTIANMHQKMFNSLEQSELTIREFLLNSPINNFDESGLGVHNKLHWLHVACNSKYTLYELHAKRGKEAMDYIGILPRYAGVAMHDHHKSYFQYLNSKHSLCNAHHIRELLGLFESYNQIWCKEMRELLLKINGVVNQAKKDGKKELTQEEIASFSKAYDLILNVAQLEVPILDNINPAKKGGRKKQHPAKNLHDRLKNYKTETLRFMFDFRSPFTNNQAEQDIRMAKLKQKISGPFRSEAGGRRFCRVRGYISTAQKHGHSAFQALECAARGQPIAF